MPTFYEGEPIEKLEMTLCSVDFEKAYLLAEKNLSPLHHGGVKAGLCLTAAILIGSSIPYYATKYSTYWIPACGVLLALAAAVYFYFIQPNSIQKWAAKVFSSNQLLCLKNEIVIFRDTVAVKNEDENYVEYWTDFHQCLESAEYYVFTGGNNRRLLILKKKEMSSQQISLLSAHFSNTFASRYRKVKH